MLIGVRGGISEPRAIVKLYIYVVYNFFVDRFVISPSNNAQRTLRCTRVCRGGILPGREKQSSNGPRFSRYSCTDRPNARTAF